MAVRTRHHRPLNAVRQQLAHRLDCAVLNVSLIELWLHEVAEGRETVALQAAAYQKQSCTQCHLCELVSERGAS